MIQITSFDPIASPGGFILPNGVNKNQQILLYNSSLVCLQLTFADKTKDILPPCWAKSWKKEGPMAHIEYDTLFVLNLNNQPISLLYGTIYEAGQHVQDVNAPLQYVYYINQ